MDLTSKVALITGAASGIGAATARRLAGLGASVVVADVDDARGEQLVDELGGAHRYRHLDVGRLDAWRELVDELERDLGGLDVLHLNAGIMTRPPGTAALDDPMTTFDEASYRRIVGVNMDGVVFGVLAAEPLLERRGSGDIVVTASEAGLAPLGLDPLYSMTKHAVVGLVRSLGAALADRGVRINCVCPAGVDTGIVPPDLRPLGRFSPPSYIADVVVDILRSGESGTVWLARGQSVGTWIVDPPALVPPTA